MTGREKEGAYNDDAYGDDYENEDGVVMDDASGTSLCVSQQNPQPLTMFQR